MRKRWMMGLGVALVAGSVATAAVAGPGGRGWGGGPGMGIGPGGGPGSCWMQVPESQLPAEQAQKLNQLRQQHQQEMAPLREQIWAKKQEMWNLRSQGNADPTAVAKLQREIFDLHSAMREKGFAFQQEVQKIDPNLRCGLGGGWGRHGMGPGGRCGMMGPGAGGPPWGTNQ